MSSQLQRNAGDGAYGLRYARDACATAFDALQKWRVQPGKMAFYKGGYFGVVESATDKATLNRFVLAVEATLPGGDEGRW